MADQEKNDQVEDTSVEETPAADAPAEPVADAAVEETASDAGDAGASADAPAEPSEPVEQLSPTERRRRKKSARNRRPKFSGTPAERHAQRVELRKKKAVKRRAQRLKSREAHKAAGPREGTPATVAQPGNKKFQQGTVVSNKNDQTIVVAIEVMEAHRIYKKVVRHTKKLVAHDATNDANEGDVVRVIESRPMSRSKRWRLVEVVERAK